MVHAVIRVRQTKIQQLLVLHLSGVGNIQIGPNASVSIAVPAARLQHQSHALSCDMRSQILLGALFPQCVCISSHRRERRTVQSQQSHPCRFALTIGDVNLDRVAIDDARHYRLNVGIPIPLRASRPKRSGMIQNGKRNKNDENGQSENDAKPRHHALP